MRGTIYWSAEEVRDVAGRVYRGLLNEQHEYSKFEFTAIGPDAVRRPRSIAVFCQLSEARDATKARRSASTE